MFFIGIFGVENKEKEIKVLDKITCKKCQSTTSGRLIKSYNFFHIFFIPLFKWNESYYILCNNCRTVFLIPKEKGKAIEQGENIELTYWDMQEIHDEYSDSNSYTHGNKICSSCGNEVNKDFKYCPYCGKMI